MIENDDDIGDLFSPPDVTVEDQAPVDDSTWGKMSFVERVRDSCDGDVEDMVEWIGARGPEATWADCRRGDWMMMLASAFHVPRGHVLRASVECVRLGAVFNKEPAVREAMDAVVSWADGETAAEELRGPARAVHALINAPSNAHTAYGRAGVAALNTVRSVYTLPCQKFAEDTLESVRHIATAFGIGSVAAATRYRAVGAEILAHRETLGLAADIIRGHVTIGDFLAAIAAYPWHEQHTELTGG
jgi:hypothetical protein